MARMQRTRSEKLAEVRGRRCGSDVEAALGRDFERRARRIRLPFGGTVQPDRELTRYDGHPFGGVGPEMELADVDDARGLPPPVPLETDALNFALEVDVVLQHGGCLPSFRAATER